MGPESIMEIVQRVMKLEDTDFVKGLRLSEEIQSEICKVYEIKAK